MQNRNGMKTENYIKAYKDERSPLTSQDIVQGLTQMQLESNELVENKNVKANYTFKHLASLLAEEKMKTMSSEEMRSIATLRKKISFKEKDPEALKQKVEEEGAADRIRSPESGQRGSVFTMEERFKINLSNKI